MTCLQATACGSTEVINILRQAGAQVNVRNAIGLTPLAFAAGRGQAQLVSTIISMGCHVDSRNKDGTTPLHQAASAGNQVCSTWCASTNALGTNATGHIQTSTTACTAALSGIQACESFCSTCKSYQA